MKKPIPFNRATVVGNELQYIEEAVQSGHISGDGSFTKRCHRFFEERFGFKKVLLTSSCTDALELAALLLDLGPGDEVIVPSFTFVSSANAFALRGAKIVFADSRRDHPNIDESLLPSLINERTKAVVVVHYAGVACDMKAIRAICDSRGVVVIEDAAHSVDATYFDKPLGGIGQLGTFSFHETKNVTCGEGGMLVINDERFVARAEILREKGTNRSAFFRGQVDKYGWVDLGSSFLPSDLNSAFLFGQLEKLDFIQARRRQLWHLYADALAHLETAGVLQLPTFLPGSVNNAHMFYMVCRTLEERTALINSLKAEGIHAVFHYLPLHASPFFQSKHDGRNLPNSHYFSDRLVRLPLFVSLAEDDVDEICTHISKWADSAMQKGGMEPARV
jgi:dTDP-4-amino-4,6-dideoxygalactose transaminase